MVADGETVIDAPVPTSVPPHEPSYQLYTAFVPSEPPLTVSVDEPEGQMLGELAVADVGAVEEVLSDTVTLWQEVVLHVPAAFT